MAGARTPPNTRQSTSLMPGTPNASGSRVVCSLSATEETSVRLPHLIDGRSLRLAWCLLLVARVAAAQDPTPQPTAPAATAPATGEPDVIRFLPRSEMPFQRAVVHAKGWLVNGKLHYQVTIWTVSDAGFTATQLTCDLASRGSVRWMPAAKELGLVGSDGDGEYRDGVAVRFGGSGYHSKETRVANDPPKAAANYQVRLQAARGVAVDAATCKGIVLQTEIDARSLGEFEANGPLPSARHDGGTSWIDGDRGVDPFASPGDQTGTVSTAFSFPF
jgi:hypothetical protein